MSTDSLVRNGALLAAAATLLGCEGAATDDAGSSAEARYAAVGQAISDEVRAADSGRFACGTPGEPPTVVLVTSASQCMGCRDVAWLIRESQRGSSTREPIWLLTSPQDAVKVCEYLAAERSLAPVYVASPAALDLPAGEDDLVLVELDSTGPRVFHAHDALLIQAARAGGTGDAPGRAP